MNDTLRQAEAYRRKALEVRQLAYRCRSIHEREAFQRLANGFNVLAAQLEQISRPRDASDETDWPVESEGQGGPHTSQRH